jgi:hypothetical protein
MKASAVARFSELQLSLDFACSELVRAFVREASLAEGVSIAPAELRFGAQDGSQRPQGERTFRGAVRDHRDGD